MFGHPRYLPVLTPAFPTRRSSELVWAIVRLREETDVSKTRFSEEQIIAVLREQEGGMKTADVCRKHGISSATLYAWKAKYGGMDVSQARKLKVLEEEN